MIHKILHKVVKEQTCSDCSWTDDINLRVEELSSKEGMCICPACNISMPKTNGNVIYAEFLVTKRDIGRLVDALGLLNSFVCNQRTKADRTEGLCLLLKRYVYPCRYSDLIHRFGQAVPKLCMITNTVEDWIYRNHIHRVYRWNADLLSPEKLQA